MVLAMDGNRGKPRTSVTGSMLGQFLNKDVRLIGLVTNMGPINTLEMHTGDNVTITVQFSQPFDEPLEGLIEVQGKAVSRDKVMGESYLVLPTILSETFDLETYSEAITFTATSENPWVVSDP